MRTENKNDLIFHKERHYNHLQWSKKRQLSNWQWKTVTGQQHNNLAWNLNA